MNNKKTYAITGAFGYTGRYITEILLEREIDASIKVLTGHPERKNPFNRDLDVIPFHFEEPDKLVDDLKGVNTFFNTYWVRFNYGGTTYGQAITNVQNLIRAASKAGVERFVHISIANPHIDLPLPYYRGKSIMEKTLINSGLSYAIVRPTLLFGGEDVLINNIAWFLRRFPVYAIFGDGDYRVQPVYVKDVAKLAVDLSERIENVICDATGAETYTFTSLVKLIRKCIHSRSRIINIHPKIGLMLSKFLNLAVRDVIITRKEIEGLMAETLVSYQKPVCETSFSKWTKKNASVLGSKYANELDRHFKRSLVLES